MNPLKEIEARGLKAVRFSFADQHGVLRGKTLAAAEVPGALEGGVTVTSTLLLKDTSHRTVFPAFTPGEIPKSSAVMTSRTLSNVLAAPSIPPNLGEVPE